MKPQPQEKNERANNHPTQHHGQEMNRKPRRGTMRKIQSDSLTLQVLRAKAAGIDMGNESHYGAVPPIGIASRCADSDAPQLSCGRWPDG